MLVSKISRLLRLLAATLMVLAGCARGSSEGDSSGLVVFRHHELRSLEEAEDYGIKIYLEEGFPGDKFVAITVCVERGSIPENVSAYFALTLNESQRSRVNDMLLSISQRMSVEDAYSSYDLGRFRVRIDLLPNVLFSLGYSDRNTGLVWDDDRWSIGISFDDIFEELMSDEWTFNADFDQVSCQQPSGRYIHELKGVSWEE